MPNLSKVKNKIIKVFILKVGRFGRISCFYSFFRSGFERILWVDMHVKSIVRHVGDIDSMLF